tara:strand:- start:425 stop:559 length:135 start_codon:yes stop_codon:yes gene_type:complete
MNVLYKNIFNKIRGFFVSAYNYSYPTYFSIAINEGGVLNTILND